jgi:hypothetical protein
MTDNFAKKKKERKAATCAHVDFVFFLLLVKRNERNSILKIIDS